MRAPNGKDDKRLAESFLHSLREFLEREWGYDRNDRAACQMAIPANVMSRQPPIQSAALNHADLPRRRAKFINPVKQITHANAAANTPAHTSGKSRTGLAVSRVTVAGTARNQKPSVIGFTPVIKSPVM